MLAFLNQVRKPTLDLPLEVRRKMWFKPFMQSYLVVFIGYLTMYLIRKNFNIAQNDMISTYGLSMTQLGMIGLGFSITYGVGKTLVSYYADGKNTKQFLPFMLILSAICMLGFSASMGSGSVSLFLMIAFYALSGFFQSTGGSCSYSTITKWTPRRKRGTFLGFWNISHNLGGPGAGIVQRLAADNASVKQSGQLIEQLSLGVYDAVRRLLGRLRPRQLDDLTLEQAIRSLMREMELEGRGIVSHLEWRIDESALSENQRVTLFRVCQEGLNNIVKHADASAVTLQGWQQDERLMLVIEDDGSGLPPGSGQQGFGLTGMRERVTALGGTLHISCLHGTRVSVSLPQRYV